MQYGVTIIPYDIVWPNVTWDDGCNYVECLQDPPKHRCLPRFNLILIRCRYLLSVDHWQYSIQVYFRVCLLVVTISLHGSNFQLMSSFEFPVFFFWVPRSLGFWSSLYFKKKIMVVHKYFCDSRTSHRVFKKRSSGSSLYLELNSMWPFSWFFRSVCWFLRHYFTSRITSRIAQKAIQFNFKSILSKGCLSITQATRRSACCFLEKNCLRVQNSCSRMFD